MPAPARPGRRAARDGIGGVRTAPCSDAPHAAGAEPARERNSADPARVVRAQRLGSAARRIRHARTFPGPALLLRSPLSDRKGIAQGKEARDSQEARVSGMAAWVRLRVDSGELAPLPLPLIESLVLGPVVAVVRRSLSGIGDVDLDEAARLLPEQIWRSVRA
ncbi:hypothetical protein [Streptomyces sp. NPDC058193]|uniref:hypothetical protein n=2 Tax=Streptomyces TaxID=1883 RepID=UPI0036E6DEEB